MPRPRVVVRVVIFEAERPDCPWRAGLYRTPHAGRYFLAGMGGLMTRFAGRERIIPLDPADALLWARRYLTRAEVEAGFAQATEEA